MNKKIISALVAVLLALPVTAQANLKNQTSGLTPTLAVIDTAINSKDPVLQGKVIYEACILEVTVKNCANGESFMEGPGAAFLSDKILYNPKSVPGNGFDHGTVMTAAAIRANPNMNIVFVRIVGVKANGNREIVSSEILSKAIAWVLQNKTKFNIKAINISQGHNNFRGATGSNYCEVASTRAPGLEGSIKNSVDQGVPVFFPTGNRWNATQIDFPSCLPISIAVGAVEDNLEEATGYNNYDPLVTDFFAPGRIEITLNNKQFASVGTSISSARAAAYWTMIAASKSNLSYSQIYELLAKTSTAARHYKYTTNRVLNINGALNG